jgi:hypothetical protein
MKNVNAALWEKEHNVRVAKFHEKTTISIVSIIKESQIFIEITPLQLKLEKMETA